MSSEPVWLAGVSAVSSQLNRLAAALAALLLVLMTTHILVEIGLRFFSRSTFMADALVGQGVAAITFLAMGWAMEKGSMIRVGLIRRRFGPLGRRLLEILAATVTLWLVLFLSAYQWRLLARDWTRGTVSEHMLPIPLWIPDAIFQAGLALLALHLLVRMLRLLFVGLQDEPEVVV